MSAFFSVCWGFLFLLLFFFVGFCCSHLGRRAAHTPRLWDWLKRCFIYTADSFISSNRVRKCFWCGLLAQNQVNTSALLGSDWNLKMRIFYIFNSAVTFLLWVLDFWETSCIKKVTSGFFSCVVTVGRQASRTMTVYISILYWGYLRERGGKWFRNKGNQEGSSYLLNSLFMPFLYSRHQKIDPGLIFQ